MLGTELIAHAWQVLVHELGTFAGVLAYVGATIGAALVVAGSFVKTMIPLRWLAVGSNVGFALYGLLHPSFVTLILSLALLPINVYRAIEMTKLTRRVRAAARAGDMSGIWLQPYMKRARLDTGTILFKKGDPGDKLYYLADGRIELAEIGEYLEPGNMFGEIAFFTPGGKRTLTARVAEPSTVLSIDGDTLRQLYYQNPSFGFQLVGLVAARLMADVQRSQRDRATVEEAAETEAAETPS